MRGAGPRALGRAKRPECVSCRPTSRSSVAAEPLLRGPPREPLAARSRSPSVSSRMTNWLGLARPSSRTATASPPQISFAPLTAEVPPPPRGQLARPAVEGPVPAFHRQDAPAVSGAKAAARKRLGKRRTRTGLHRPVERQRQMQLGQSCDERVGRLQAGDAGEGHCRPIVYRIFRKEVRPFARFRCRRDLKSCIRAALTLPLPTTRDAGSD